MKPTGHGNPCDFSKVWARLTKIILHNLDLYSEKPDCNFQVHFLPLMPENSSSLREGQAWLPDNVNV